MKEHCLIHFMHMCPSFEAKSHPQTHPLTRRNGLVNLVELASFCDSVT